MTRILVFHQFNDYSGSPKVLKMTIEALLAHNNEVVLFTSKGGILDEINNPGLLKHHIPYKFHKSKLITLLCFLWSEILMFANGIRYGKKDNIFLINTIMPAGAAIAGKIKGARIIYHYHENAFAKGKFYTSLAKIMERTAHKIICVSEYQKSHVKAKSKCTVIPNAIPHGQHVRFKYNPSEAFDRKNVLLITSLKTYKGVVPFIRIAEQLPQYKFTLVINADQPEIELFLRQQSISIPYNLHIYPRQKDVVPFYNDSSISLNLSDKRYVIETFGLTAIEAMCAGLPVIVPDVGGISDLVRDYYNGFKVDVLNIQNIIDRISELMTNRELYCEISQNAYMFSQKFRERVFSSAICDIITKTSTTSA